MQYIKTAWVNESDPEFDEATSPPLGQINLNKIEQGIYDNSTHAESAHAPADLLTIHVVSTTVDRDLLNPNEGDFCQVTEHNRMYLYKDSWIDVQREDIIVSTVSTIVDRDLLAPRAADICVVTDTSQSFVWSGLSWVEILASGGSVQDAIQDTVISTTTLWSSNKTSTVLLDGGDF